MPAQILFEDRYKKLNKEQKKAVDTIEGPLLVVAGPGSGKTEILSLRVGNILRKTDTLPSNILCLTFTESAALNMRDRLAKLIGPEAFRVAIHTFHNFCVEIIQKYPEFFYNGAVFSPADPISQIAIMEEILENLPYDNPLRSIHPAQGFIYLLPSLKAIAYLKKAGLTPSEFKNILEHNKKSYEVCADILCPFFDDRLNKKNLPKLEESVKKIEEVFLNETLTRPFPSDFFHPYTEVLLSTLKKALQDTYETESSKPLSVWKEKTLKRDDNGKRVMKEDVSHKNACPCRFVHNLQGRNACKMSF